MVLHFNNKLKYRDSISPNSYNITLYYNIKHRIVSHSMWTFKIKVYKLYLYYTL